MMRRAEQQIELFSPENIESVAALAAASFSTPWTLPMYQRELDNPQSVGFVCKVGGETAGFIHCDFVLDELSLNALAVAEPYRRQGIARALWNEVRWLMTDVCKVCFLEVRESNLPARTLYESLGFVQNGYRKRYYREPEEAAVLMEYHF